MKMNFPTMVLTDNFSGAIRRIQNRFDEMNRQKVLAYSEEMAEYMVYHYPKIEVYYKNSRYGVQPIS
jgi:hypothetical protein